MGFGLGPGWGIHEYESSNVAVGGGFSSIISATGSIFDLNSAKFATIDDNFAFLQIAGVDGNGNTLTHEFNNTDDDPPNVLPDLEADLQAVNFIWTDLASVQFVAAATG